MNKYYTPEIEEFHVGFEYEDKFFNYPEEEKNWKKRVYEVNDSYSLQLVATRIKLDCIRVKHLDREDIESLGFKYSRYSGSYTQYFTKDNVEISIGSGHRKDSPLRVKRIWSISNEIVFKGTIKNKSELKKLLKQLGI